MMLLLVVLLLGAARVDGREKSDDLMKRSLSTMLQRYDVDMFQHPSAGQQGIHKTCYNYFLWYEAGLSSFAVYVSSLTHSCLFALFMTVRPIRSCN